MPYDRSQIPGWGADLDRRNRPAVPMEHMPPRLDVAPPDPQAQPQTVEILHSVERPGLTPVYGTSCPPKGLSGRIRRRAFRRSENDVRHWMLLLLADRVDVVESLFHDARRSPRTHSIAAVGLIGLLAAFWLMRR